MSSPRLSVWTRKQPEFHMLLLGQTAGWDQCSWNHAQRVGLCPRPGGAPRLRRVPQQLAVGEAVPSTPGLWAPLPGQIWLPWLPWPNSAMTIQPAGPFRTKPRQYKSPPRVPGLGERMMVGLV